jgi:hypothetical protein
MIIKMFSPKNSAKKLAFLTQNKGKLCKILIITLVFEKNANFFAENWQKSQKIVIITSTPGSHDPWHQSPRGQAKRRPRSRQGNGPHSFALRGLNWVRNCSSSENSITDIIHEVQVTPVQLRFKYVRMYSIRYQRLKKLCFRENSVKIP